MSTIDNDDEDIELTKEMQAIKTALVFIPRRKLEKILLYHYFVKPTGLNELLDVWETTNKKLDDAIKEHIKVKNG